MRVEQAWEDPAKWYFSHLTPLVNSVPTSHRVLNNPQRKNDTTDATGGASGFKREVPGIDEHNLINDSFRIP